MMQLSEAAALLGARFSGADATLKRVCTDTRTLQAGDLFFALRGERYDGGAYAAKALALGAAGVVLDTAQAPEINSALRVADTRLALGALAAAWRRRFAIPLVAITGSNGKTTVKEMLAAILRNATSSLPLANALPEKTAAGVAAARPLPNPDGTTSHSTKPASGQVAGYLPLAGEGANVMPKAPLPNPLPLAGEGANVMPKAINDAVLATEGNLNNDIGLPLMLLRLRDGHRYAVLEMGMNHVGEIDYLTRLARPDVALVNNAQAAHVGLLGSVEAIARAKAEIFNGLDAAGIAVINSDDPHAPLWRAANAGRRIIGFGLSPDADIRGEIVADAQGSRLRVFAPGATLDLHLQVPGAHNACNALAAAAAAFALEIPSAAIERGLSGFGGVKGRLQTRPALHGSTFIDDTYNANPDSVRAALQVLALRPGNKIFVLGDMGELGADAAALHAQVGLAARTAGVERLLALGELSREAVGAFGAGAMHFERIEELLAELENALTADTTVLVKGSRFMKMERVVQSFMETH